VGERDGLWTSSSEGAHHRSELRKDRLKLSYSVRTSDMQTGIEELHLMVFLIIIHIKMRYLDLEKYNIMLIYINTKHFPFRKTGCTKRPEW
jgi:hypothetical protein